MVIKTHDYRDRVATAVFQAIVEASDEEASSSGACGLDIEQTLDALTLVMGVLFLEMGAGKSDDAAKLITENMAENVRRRMCEIDAFRQQTGCSLFPDTAALLGGSRA